MFPLIIKYKRELTENIESQQVFDVIEKELIRLGVDKFKHSDLEIKFKNSFFNGQGRWHLMAPVDKGYFKLDRKLWKLEYSFSVIRTFYISLAFSFFFGLISQSYKFGIIIFLWFFGMNWIITLIRQNVFMNKMKRKLIKKNTTHNKELR
ncbi:hypothetical protein M4I21_18175 [Cellulophaga sp. 20_2_10]|uniref:hypothetical protein n=1 Tax=Cellulophaga sp. 20_2_10 TaxID=2942476 RepID=UPI00201AE9A4|nr:hypothetical protein [Cellulophaga sp. 20_2_10]MCL5247746.1 hypothetical protein [Cellulophaga sp. 20_2_10]